LGDVAPADNRSTADICEPAGDVAMRIETPGVYLTDEVFLYRVVGSIAGGVDPVVEVEDCYCLDVVRVAVSALRSRQLRVVAAAVDG
jgi:hypothetical protein